MNDRAESALSSLIVFGCVERMLETSDTNASHAAVRKIIRVCKAEGQRLIKIYDAERSKP